jgi:hypothetical protein
MSSCETVNQLMELLEPLESEIVALAANKQREPVQPALLEPTPANISPHIPVT